MKKVYFALAAAMVAGFVYASGITGGGGGASAFSDLTGSASVSQGGTGQTSLTSGSAIVGNGTSAVTLVAPSTSGNLLTSNGSTWTSAAPAAASITYPLTADDSYSVSTPSYSRSGDANTGVGFPAADNISLIAGGTQVSKYSLDANAGGYLGSVMGSAGTAGIETYQIASNAVRIKNYMTTGAVTWYYGVGPNNVNGFEIGAGSSPILYVYSGLTSIRIKTGGVSMATRETGVGGTAETNTTAVGNVGAGEDNLITSSVGGSMLDVNGARIHWKAFGTSAAATSTVKCYFGATQLISSGTVAFAGNDWVAEGDVIRTSATAQIATSTFKAGTVVDTNDYTTPAETLSGAITFKCTAEGTADNDISQKGMIVEWYPNS